MRPLCVLGDRETVLAFALGGVAGRVVHTPDEAGAVLAAAVAELRAQATSTREPGLVLVTRATANAVRAEVDRLALDTAGPLVVEIPGFGEPLGTSPVEAFVTRVLGVRL